MIKNWLVKTKQIKKGSKGLKNYLHYLQNDNAVSHFKTVFDKPINAGSKLLDAYDLRRYDRQSKGLRGGGVKNHATSWVISCPPNVHPSPDQWKKIAKDVLKDLGKELNLSPKDLAKHSFINVHNEKKSGKYSHLNIVLSNIINNDFRKDITQHKATWAVKHSINKAFKQHLGIDNRTYTPRDKWKIGKNKPLWAARLDNAKTELTEIIERKNSQNQADFEKLADVAMARLSDYFESIKKPSLLSKMFSSSDKRKTKTDHKKELLTQSLVDLDNDSMIDKILYETKKVEEEFEVCPDDMLEKSRARIESERAEKAKQKAQKEKDENDKTYQEALKKAYDKAQTKKKKQSRKGRNTKRRNRNKKP